MVLLKGFCSLLTIIALVLAVLFVDFVYKTFSFRARDVRTDAIVVLAGGRGRIEEGVRLYREQPGSALFLIGVDPTVRKGDLFRERRGERGGEDVYLEKVSRNTLENALYARQILERHQVRSLRLITSRYHMKRSLLIFRSILPKDVAIYPHPVTATNVNKDEWWSHGGSLRLLFSEFYKYCLFRFFFLFSPNELRTVTRYP
ncbi:YdcF family protein [Geobacter argillaceus]|uniref:Uncharacterized SAM-binding protein YcdF (DUF218 family) n=1 Tax=Geobacter argillaceus TaxID=345631 RepID=A0A562W842_9BACT|nr:YdcF family protein [Geobacter argillaceus]TWJ26372.1 uncharacterized SAM-binding protein YcdF (DUF218 family) [Geobacter argillaceus]